MKPSVRSLTAGLAFGILALGSEALHAQSYPTRIITMIVAAAPGGPGDTAARLIVDKMSSVLGQQIIVENIPGAGGITATARVARAEPDGYTLLIQQTGFAIAPSLYPKLTFDVEKDFTAIGMVNASYSFLVGRKSLPANDLKELIAWMKGPGHPAKFAHPGPGTLAHLTAVTFGQSIGTGVDLIPYRGGGPAMNDIIAGHVDLVWAASSTSAELIKAGTVKAFGYGSGKPYGELPNIPAFGQIGYPEHDVRFWHALYAPRALPQPIIQRLNFALREALADPQVKKAYADRGLEAFPPDQLTPDFANSFLHSEIERWGKVVRDNHIQAVN